MADDGLDGRGTAHLAFDLGRYPTLLLGQVDFELVIGRRIVTSVTGIGMEPFDRIADELLDRRDDTRQRMSIIRTARQRLHVGDELPALAVLEGGGHLRVVATLTLTPNS